MNKKGLYLIKYKVSTVFFFYFFLQAEQVPFDLTVIGLVNFADGIGRQAVGLIDCLKNDLTINFINTRKKRSRYLNVQDVPIKVVEILQKEEPGTSNVAILEDVLSNGNKLYPEYYYKYVPEHSTIRFAYSMFESTAIPQEWVTILNAYFDAVVVPDPFLITVYKNSGVTIPIFMVPLGIYIEDFLSFQEKKSPHTPFTFGFSGAFSERKNHMLLLQSFAEEFGNNPNVMLRIHGRFGNQIYNTLASMIKTLNLSNVELIHKNFSWQQYIDFMTSIDCYVSISRGEGFSITPREALACGIPTIISNNTAQKTIGNSGYVRTVPSSLEAPAFYEHLQEYVGTDFNCSLDDVKTALRDVYEHYSTYLQKAQHGRIWVSQYLYSNLRSKYLSLIKPKKIILGDENLVEDDYVITNSKALYDKFTTFIKQ